MAAEYILPPENQPLPVGWRMVSRGTPVKLFDGRVIHIEDVRTGDALEQYESGYIPVVERVAERILPGYSFISTAAPGLEIDSRAYMKIGGIWAYPTRRYQAMMATDAVVYDVYLVGAGVADNEDFLSYMAGGHIIAAANNPVYGQTQIPPPHSRYGLGS
jgi:hypothetical protein